MRGRRRRRRGAEVPRCAWTLPARASGLDVHHGTTLVVVLETDDIILTEVLAALHLDDDERDHPRVLQTMVDADRDKGRFVDVDDLLLVIQDDAVLCSDFIPGAICAIEAKPNALVSFFAARAYDFRAPVDRGPAWLSTSRLYGSQAVVLPSRLATAAAAHLTHAIGEHDDHALCNFAHAHGVPVLVTVPGLVDHADVPSLLGHAPLRSDRFIGTGSAYGMAWHTAPTHEVIA